MDYILNRAATPERTIRVGVISGIQFLGFAYMLASFRHEHPEVFFDIHESSNLRLIEMVGDGEIDTAFAINPRPRAGVVSHCLYDDELVLITAPDHPLAERGEVALGDLEGETLLVSESDTMYADFQEILRRDAPEVRLKYYLTHDTGILNNIGLVANGFGIAVLSRQVAEGCQDIDFVKVKITPRYPRTFSLAVNAVAAAKPIVSTFVSYVVENFCEDR